MARHSSGLVATYRGGTRHPITPTRLAGATILGATITASLAVPVAAFASPTTDDNAPLTQADFYPMPEPDDIKYDDTAFDPSTMEPDPYGDGMAEYAAWLAAGKPGYVADQGGAKGVEPITQSYELPDATDSTPPALPTAAHDWDGVAMCESSGNWQANTGNGYYGGLQIWEPTWIDFGGWEFATLPHEATKAQQIIVAERILAVQGNGAWPTCGEFLSEPVPVPPPAPPAPNLNAPCPSHINLTGADGLVPNAHRLLLAVCAVFGNELVNVGGWRADGMGAPDHPEGRAIDFGVQPYQIDLGYRINDWILANAAEYNVQYTLWQVAQHYDHVHVSVNY